MYGVPVGSKLVTASGELFAAGDVVRVFNINIISGGTPGVFTMGVGGASGTTWIKETGTANTGKTIDYGINGQLFNNGCYCTVDGNTTSVLIACRKELA